MDAGHRASTEMKVDQPRRLCTPNGWVTPTPHAWPSIAVEQTHVVSETHRSMPLGPAAMEEDHVYAEVDAIHEHRDVNPKWTWARANPGAAAMRCMPLAKWMRPVRDQREHSEIEPVLRWTQRRRLTCCPNG